MHQLSKDGVRFIAGFEGFRPYLYNDQGGHCTIGYGHLVHRGKTNGTEPEEFRRDITEQRGRELLQQDAAGHGAAVAKSVRVLLTRHQFDALVSFCFNVGAGAFEGSTLLKKLNAGQHDAVPQELLRWTKTGGKESAGLKRRRKAEGDLFQNGNYGFQPDQPEVRPAPPPVVTITKEEDMKTQFLTMSLGKTATDAGMGWMSWDPGVGHPPTILGVVKQGPYPPENGYWPDQSEVELSAQARGNEVIVTARGGKPGQRIGCYVAVA